MRAVVSVLLPVHDGARTVRRAVLSSLRALPRNAELLVFDDGSTDDTGAVLESIDDPRLQVLGSPRPLGVAGGLNRLLDAASAPYVARIDADDVTLPGRFGRQLRAVRAGVDVDFAGHVRFGDNLGAFRQKRGWHLSPETVRVWLALENPLTHPAMFARTAVVRSVGGYRPGPAEDYDLWLRLAADGARIERSASPGIAYRMHGGQLTMRPGYLASLLRDPGLGEAHERLTRSLGWDGVSVWPVLWVPARAPAERETKERFWRFLEQRSRSLDAVEGLLLRQALARALPGSTAPGWSVE